MSSLNCSMNSGVRVEVPRIEDPDDRIEDVDLTKNSDDNDADKAGEIRRWCALDNCLLSIFIFVFFF